MVKNARIDLIFFAKCSSSSSDYVSFQSISKAALVFSSVSNIYIFRPWGVPHATKDLLTHLPKSRRKHRRKRFQTYIVHYFITRKPILGLRSSIDYPKCLKINNLIYFRVWKAWFCKTFLPEQFITFWPIWFLF